MSTDEAVTPSVMTGEPQVLFETRGSLARITLNRPAALNALNEGMCAEILAQLDRWSRDDRIAVIAIDGAGGRHFCAGGDIRMLAEQGPDAAARRRGFFETEYRMNAAIHRLQKPFVAFLDGACMGGGVGVSAFGSHRLGAERLAWAMPETAIGMVPDVGGSWLLPRLGKGMGRYLGLVGRRLDAIDCLALGLVTDLVPRGAWDDLMETFAALPYGADGDAVDAAVASVRTEPDGESALRTDRDAIHDVFAHATVEAMMDALDGEDGDWAEAARDALSRACPFSVKATFELLNRGSILPFDQALANEFRVTMRITERADFQEGVRAVVVEKTRDAQWSPAALADVDSDEIMALFEPAPGGDLILS